MLINLLDNLEQYIEQVPVDEGKIPADVLKWGAEFGITGHDHWPFITEEEVLTEINALPAEFCIDFDRVRKVKIF